MPWRVLKSEWYFELFLKNLVYLRFRVFPSDFCSLFRVDNYEAWSPDVSAILLGFKIHNKNVFERSKLVFYVFGRWFWKFWFTNFIFSESLNHNQFIHPIIESVPRIFVFFKIVISDPSCCIFYRLNYEYFAFSAQKTHFHLFHQFFQFFRPHFFLIFLIFRIFLVFSHWHWTCLKTR